jgi:biopolymer transport protein ExbB/TolQ
MPWTVPVVLGLTLASTGVAVWHAFRPEARLMILAIIGAAVSFTAGLLATVLGLIHAFAAVAGADPSTKATLLAMGISEAMNCTAFSLSGLLLWIPAFVIGEYRRRRWSRKDHDPS